MMPDDIVCAKDTRDLLIDCCVGNCFLPVDITITILTMFLFYFFSFCVEFIHLIASEANEICEKETKKTIAGEHVVAALQALGFEEYVEEVDEVFKEHKKQQKVDLNLCVYIYVCVWFINKLYIGSR